MLVMIRKKKKKKKAATKKRRSGPPMARKHDKHDLYQQSVQEPDADVVFFNRVFKKEFKKPPRIFREDFCGTAFCSCAWVKAHRENRAIAIDLDPDPLEWGRRHNVADLGAKQRERLTLHQGNALEQLEPKADIVSALNFSYFVFKERDQLREYFQAAYDNIKKQGLFIIDLEGGTEVMDEHEEERKQDGFTYVWEQHSFDGITHETTCFIHFRFPDGSMIKRAFRYDWRLWTMPEIRDLMLEVGFRRADVYWEGTDKHGEGNGVFTRREKAENCEAWIAYVVGVK